MRRVVLLLSLLVALSGCATHAPIAAPATTFVLVRHAEKASDDPRDPSLSAAGVERARRIAASLHDARIIAVYATPFRRTQLTAAPTANDHDLTVTTYDPARAADEFAAELRLAKPDGTVLVVGHSNTIPALAHSLCHCVIEPIADDEFGRRITIRLLADGRATVDDRREP